MHYGLQSLPERAGVYQRLLRGDTAILYVSPEQLRSKRFADAIASRSISGWVFDEAHCLAKWDMCPDYLYAGRFIKEMAQRQEWIFRRSVLRRRRRPTSG